MKKKKLWLIIPACLFSGLFIISSSFLFSPNLGSFPQLPPESLQSPSPLEQLESLIDVWDKGDFLVALKGFERLLSSSTDEAIFERIALVTGSLFKITELAPDGRQPRFSLDGQYLAIDFGPREDPGILIYKTGQKYEKIAEIKGTKGTFSPDGSIFAYFKIPPTQEIAEIRKQLAQMNLSASPDRARVSVLQARLSLAEAREARLVLRELPGGEEKELDLGSLLKGDFIFSPDGTKIYLVASLPADNASTQIYSLSLAGNTSPPAITPITSGPGYKINPVAVPGNRFLVYQNFPSDPFSRQALASGARGDEAQSATRPQEGSAGGAQTPGLAPGQFSRQPARSFSLLDLNNGQIKTFEGSSVVVSPPGDSLAYLKREGNENLLLLIKLDENLTPKVIKKASAPLASPAFSPDGKQIAFEMSVDGNNEIFLIDLESHKERRITREIQPDRQPRFLSADKIIAFKGEPRHSRSYLYDLKTGKTLRLVHNDTIRTIVPEYEWAIHPRAEAMVVVADYDGDTISPERGVYLVNLSQRISREELLARLRKQYEAERALRAKAEEFIRPLAPQIKEIIARISRRRLFEYQKTLFDFDSKHVTQPGNLKAIEYLQRTLASFGYEPELQWLPDRPYKTANVVAILKGTENPDLYYLLCSHFDSVARGPGADDNSSSTAVLLETARVLARHPLPSSLIFAAFTGEESGLWGSREFARLARERKLQVLGAINNDTIGWTEDHRLDNTIRYANSGLRDLMHAASIGFSRMVTYDSHYIRSTDAVPLFEAFGNVVAGLGSHPVLGNPYYHTEQDRLEVVNQELIEEATKFMVASVIMMTSSPLPVRDVKALLKEDGSVEITWAPNPEKGIAYYLVTCQLGDKGQIISKKVEQTRTSFQIKKLVKASSLEKIDASSGKIHLKISVRAVNRRGLPSWDETVIIL